MIATAERQTWRTAPGVAEPPKDRVIRIVANIVDHDEWSTSVESFEGLARWDERSQDWLNAEGLALSIRGFYESELVILEWREANECRQFIIKTRWNGKDDVQRLVSRPVAGMLPPPSWHSDTDSSGDHRPQIFAMMKGCSDRELVTLTTLHRRFLDTAAWWRDNGALRHLPYREREEIYRNAETVQHWMAREVEDRFTAALEKRELAGVKSGIRRRQKKERSLR